MDNFMLVTVGFLAYLLAGFIGVSIFCEIIRSLINYNQINHSEAQQMHLKTNILLTVIASLLAMIVMLLIDGKV
jgi:uncharacterized membrane protein SpoIIM required for sporulation